MAVYSFRTEELREKAPCLHAGDEVFLSGICFPDSPQFQIIIIFPSVYQFQSF